MMGLWWNVNRMVSRWWITHVVVLFYEYVTVRWFFFSHEKINFAIFVFRENLKFSIDKPVIIVEDIQSIIKLRSSILTYSIRKSRSHDCAHHLPWYVCQLTSSIQCRRRPLRMDLWALQLLSASQHKKRTVSKKEIVEFNASKSV